MFFRVEERTTVIFFQGVSLTGTSDYLVSNGVCKQHTAPRASFTDHTRIFSRVHVAQVLEPERWVGCSSCEP